jgi:hypothetical protein
MKSTLLDFYNQYLQGITSKWSRFAEIFRKNLTKQLVELLDEQKQLNLNRRWV